MDGAGRKMFPASLEEIGRCPHVARWDVMGDVNQRGKGRLAEQNGFHFPHVGIRTSEVRQQSDDWHGLVSRDQLWRKRTWPRTTSTKAPNVAPMHPLGSITIGSPARS